MIIGRRHSSVAIRAVNSSPTAPLLTRMDRLVANSKDLDIATLV
jgi:hypothetical protein